MFLLAQYINGDRYSYFKQGKKTLYVSAIKSFCRNELNRKGEAEGGEGRGKQVELLKKTVAEQFS